MCLQLVLEIHIGREPMKRLKQASALQGLRPAGLTRIPPAAGSLECGALVPPFITALELFNSLVAASLL